MSRFEGYSDETFEFFMAIRFNNNKPFFQENRDWYLHSVREPSLALAEELSEVIEKMDHELERRPYRVLSHINRDVRFSRDKSPYRDYLWLGFKRVGEDQGKSLTAYFDLSDSGSNYGIGVYKDNAELMRNLRQKMIATPHELGSILNELGDGYRLFTNKAAKIKAPENVPKELVPWYEAKGFYIEKPIEDFELIKSAELAEVLKDGFQKLTPLYQYIQNSSVEKE